MADTDQTTYCNARINGTDVPKIDPGPHGGDGYCSRPAGWGTEAESGRCKLHNGRKSSHGLYSFKREELEEKFREAYSGESWADLRAEIAAVRALLSDYLEGLDEVDGETIGDATKLFAELRRMTGDLQEMLHRERLTRDEEQKLFNTFATIIRDHVPESDQDAALAKLESVGAGGERRALPDG